MQNILIDSFKKLINITLLFIILFILTACPPDKYHKAIFSIQNNRLVISAPLLNEYFNGEYICIFNRFYLGKWDGKRFNTIWSFKFDSKNKLTPKISLINNELMYGQVPKSSITKIKPKKLTSGIYIAEGGVSAFYAKDKNSNKGKGGKIIGYCDLQIDTNGNMRVKNLDNEDLKELGIF